MRAETKPPGGFDISPEITAALDNMAIFRTLCGSASEKSGEFGLGGGEPGHRAVACPRFHCPRSGAAQDDFVFATPIGLDAKLDFQQL